MAATSGGEPTTRRRLTAAPLENAAAQTYELLAGIPQHGTVLGYADAPATLQFFADLQCRESRQVMLGALPPLIRRFVRTGELQIRFRSRETDTAKAGGWFEFREQQVAAMAAGRQHKFWNFVDVFFREQGPEYTGYVSEAFLNRLASQAGLEHSSWLAARQNPAEWVPQIEADEALAKSQHLKSTPSFLIGPTGGAARPLLHFSLEEPGAFEAAIRKAL